MGRLIVAIVAGVGAMAHLAYKVSIGEDVGRSIAGVCVVVFMVGKIAIEERG